MEIPRPTFAQRIDVASDDLHLAAMDYAARASQANIETQPSDSLIGMFDSAMLYARRSHDDYEVAWSRAFIAMCAGGAVVRIEVRRNGNQEPASLSVFDAALEQHHTRLAQLRSPIAHGLDSAYTIGIINRDAHYS